MEHETHYDTVSTAISELRKRGFTVDFNLAENHISCDSGKFKAEEFHIADIYRYEGQSDPADEAAVYAIESVSGIKGILVTGYGWSTDDMSTELLKKLST